jgi:hypothetical protein
MHSSYFEWYRMGNNRYFLRQKLVAYARAHELPSFPSGGEVVAGQEGVGEISFLPTTI